MGSGEGSDKSANADLAKIASSITGIRTTEGQIWRQAEDAELSSGAEIVRPESAWTGESNWSGDYVQVPAGQSVVFPIEDLPEATYGVRDPMTAHPLFRRLAEDAGTATWTAIDTHGDRTELGIQELGGAGPRGVTEWDGLLRPFPLDRPVPGGTVAIEVTSDGDLQLDALMLLPAVTAAVYSTTGKDVILRAGTADGEITVPVVAGETGRAYRPDGTGGRPFNRGRRALAEGAFAITDR